MSRIIHKGQHSPELKELQRLMNDKKKTHMDKAKLKEWLSVAVDGRNSDAYGLLLYYIPEFEIGDDTIQTKDLLVVLESLSKQWDKEISIAIRA